MIIKSSLLSFLTIIAAVSLTITIFACSKKTSSAMVTESPDLYEMINKEMGRKVTTIDNDAGDHVLCIKKEGSLLSSFMVVSKNGQVVIDKKKVRGTVAWYDNKSIEVTIIPGVIDQTNDQPQTQKTIIPFKVMKEAI